MSFGTFRQRPLSSSSFAGLCLAGLLDISADVPFEPRSLQTCFPSTFLSPATALALAPPPRQPALPHPLVPCTFLSPLAPHCWRKALPWVRAGLSGLGDWVLPRAPLSSLWSGWVISWGLTSTPGCPGPQPGAEVGDIPCPFHLAPAAS